MKRTVLSSKLKENQLQQETVKAEKKEVEEEGRKERRRDRRKEKKTTCFY